MTLPATQTSPATLRVLLIEDSPGDAALVSEMLREADPPPFELVHFERLADAHESIASESVDCMLLDLSLPDSNGLDGVNYVLSRASDVPVVVLTGSDNEKLALRALEEGVQDYLVKGKADPQIIGRSIRYAIERKRADAELARQAFHDSLTGLPNRALFLDRLALALARLTRRGSSVAVLFIDLDNFKYVNDSLGHAAGDELLIRVGERLGAAVRPERHGGPIWRRRIRPALRGAGTDRADARGRGPASTFAAETAGRGGPGGLRHREHRDCRHR